MEDQPISFIKKHQRTILWIGAMVGLWNMAYYGGALMKQGYRHWKKQAAEKEAFEQTNARLIDKSIGSDHGSGYTALLFLDTDGNTNTAEFVVTVVTDKGSQIEALRQLKPFRVQKVAEWREVLKKQYLRYYWDNVDGKVR